MSNTPEEQLTTPKRADWELDFYSRPIIEPDGKKRWELLIISTEDASGSAPFKWEKCCPASEVNSLWLTEAIKEALAEAQKQGWEIPLRIRCWRTSMKTMVKKAATALNIEVIPSRRTYSLCQWLTERERDLYPTQKGYMAGPLAPPPTPILNQAVPLPEAVRGDALTLASLSIGLLREAEEWPMEFSGLTPIGNVQDENLQIPGLRIFSKSRSLALAGWLGGLEPVRLLIEGNQLLLEAGQEDRWLVTDLDKATAKNTEEKLLHSRENAGGLQFIAIQSTPEVQSFTGFWMLRDLPRI
ncbi:Tab2/Atab2 family RNA-binding protein [Prochlorococcus sp. MIT 1300]|uniref:Tab2/Atab2 family RNA-binding protein n=1 Tax=Prochlorococcus sp. MIT 1300 TaxID=3096218 RepID=UPI002A75FE74|nr:Tab2/Atab2 family RNA-binding protein [Prochlorococcus sp. MIT 1300]